MLATAQTPAANGLNDPRWKAVFGRLLLTEGGFVDSPADPGGATKYGLSLRYLAQQAKIVPALLTELDIHHDGPISVPDIAKMTVADAAIVYYQFFWSPPGPSTLPQPLDAAVFDQAVNDGLTPAVKMLQLALNFVGCRVLEPLAVDGGLGADTRARLNVLIATRGAPAVLDAYRAQAVFRYHYIAHRDRRLATFLPGWLTRAAELGDV